MSSRTMKYLATCISAFVREVSDLTWPLAGGELLKGTSTLSAAGLNGDATVCATWVYLERIHSVLPLLLTACNRLTSGDYTYKYTLHIA